MRVQPVKRWHRPAWVVLSLLSASACRHGSDVPEWRARPGRAEGRVYHYKNDRGQTVITFGAAAEQPISKNVAISAQLLADRVIVQRAATVVENESNQYTGHSHDDVDAITSASVSVTGGERLDKTRYEGIVGATLFRGTSESPSRLGILFRYSGETDYQSYSGRVLWTSELLEQNTTLGGFVGYGYDTVLPLRAPPGEAALWPASHARVNAGISLSQILSPRWVASGGLAVTRQFGTLSNPYRRARVRTTLFPERLPGARTRFTAYATFSYYLGWEMALHLRPGAYVDSWAVYAFIPEIAWARELGTRGLVSLKYRFYGQTAASFYETVYVELEPLRTNDVRLASFHEHSPGLELEWTLFGRRGQWGSMTATTSYRFSLLVYPQAHQRVRAHIFGLGLGGAY
jgi:hypothetical protein